MATSVSHGEVGSYGEVGIHGDVGIHGEVGSYGQVGIRRRRNPTGGLGER